MSDQSMPGADRRARDLASIAWLAVKVLLFLVFALAPLDVVVIAYQQF